MIPDNVIYIKHTEPDYAVLYTRMPEDPTKSYDGGDYHAGYVCERDLITNKWRGKYNRLLHSAFSENGFDGSEIEFTDAELKKIIKLLDKKDGKKVKKAKSTFRSGDSQGKDMIRNMNRMTETTVKRFQK